MMNTREYISISIFHNQLIENYMPAIAGRALTPTFLHSLNQLFSNMWLLIIGHFYRTALKPMKSSAFHGFRVSSCFRTFSARWLDGNWDTSTLKPPQNKNLDVLDQTFTFNEYFDYVKKKVSKSLAMLCLEYDLSSKQ